MSPEVLKELALLTAKFDAVHNQEALEHACVELGQLLAALVPPGIGFTLLLSDHGPAGFTSYLSTIKREDTINLLREMAEHLEK
jgi:hypothetical protein